MTDLYFIRTSNPDDQPFIYSTFLRSLYYGNSWFTLIKKDSFMKNYHRVVEALLQNSQIDVACLKEDPSVILGYVIHRANLLHFVFVKKVWRKIGIAKSLIPSKIDTVTHLTKQGILMLKKNNWEFDPFSL